MSGFNLIHEFEEAVSPAYVALASCEPLRCAETGDMHPALPHPKLVVLDVRYILIRDANDMSANTSLLDAWIYDHASCTQTQQGSDAGICVGVGQCYGGFSQALSPEIREIDCRNCPSDGRDEI